MVRLWAQLKNGLPAFSVASNAAWRLHRSGKDFNWTTNGETSSEKCIFPSKPIVSPMIDVGGIVDTTQCIVHRAVTSLRIHNAIAGRPRNYQCFLLEHSTRTIKIPSIFGQSKIMIFHSNISKVAIVRARMMIVFAVKHNN